MLNPIIIELLSSKIGSREAIARQKRSLRIIML
jgi:hypothetical protein